MITDSNKKQIEELIGNSKIFVFMKGQKHAPMCGFSANVTNILSQVGADYETFDILEDAEIRQAIKEYTSWPTIPQIFIDGKFVGGSDILQELFDSGELKKLVEA